MACVLEVLQEHGGRIHITEIHEQVNCRLKMTLPRQPLKDCLPTYSAGERPRIRRIKRGWYAFACQNQRITSRRPWFLVVPDP
jgi:hypothetical protein